MVTRQIVVEEIAKRRLIDSKPAVAQMEETDAQKEENLTSNEDKVALREAIVRHDVVGSHLAAGCSPREGIAPGEQSGADLFRSPQRDGK